MGETKEYIMESFDILYLANSGEIFGGGQISLMGLIKGLNRMKFHPLVLCPAEGSLVDELNKMSVETQIIRMETLRNLNIFSWMRTINRLIQIIQRRKIDLIHSNGSRPTIYGGIAARLTKIPLIWHVRIADSDRLLDKLLAKLAVRIIVVSKAVGRRFNWLKDKENKVAVIYNGIDLEKFNPAVNGEKIRKEFHLSLDTPLVGIVGRLDWYKGHQYFLQAAKKVAEAIPDTHFLIVGDGEYRERLENLRKELGLNENVIFTGNREDIPQILADIDIFALSSVSEGFGRSAAEAMACAKPVVATKVGSLPEVVDDGITGSLVLPRNPNALAEAIITLLQNKEKAQRMGQAGRKRVEKMFSLQQNIRQTGEIYEEILQIRKECKD